MTPQFFSQCAHKEKAGCCSEQKSESEGLWPVTQHDRVMPGGHARLHHDAGEGLERQGLTVDGGMPAGNVGDTEA
jgi:hypothetical protein